MTDFPQSQCSRHPDRKAVGKCNDCGKAVCEECRVEHDGKVVCAVCLDEKTGIKKTAHKRGKWIVVSFVLVAIGIGAWFAFEQYPRLKQKAFQNFVLAIKAGKPTEEVMSQLPWWLSVNDKDNSGFTSLLFASMYGTEEIAQILIEHGADVNAKDHDNGMTPLNIATIYGKDKVALVLIKHGADVNPKTNNGLTPLHYAAAHGKDKVARTLIEHGADVNAKANNGKTPLDLAGLWRSKKKKVIITLLRKHGAKTGAEFAIKELKQRINENADVNPKGKDGRTLLHNAASNGWKDIISLLLKNGADVNAIDKNGRTPLHWAVRTTEDKVVRALIDHGADVNAKNIKGWTPLHSAVSQGNDKIVRTLIEHGADVNAKTSKGKTPLHFAVTYHKEKVAKILIEGGADVNTKNNNGYTPLDWAYDNDQIATLLRKHGAMTGAELKAEEKAKAK